MNGDGFEMNEGTVKLAIQLSEGQGRRIAEIAALLDISAESLAEAAARELVEPSDSEFDNVAMRLLDKNRELYERLP